MARIASVVVAATLCFGCAQIESQVSVFHRLPKQLDPATFAVVPAVEGMQGSLEFEAIVQPLVERLQALGLERVEPANRPRYVVAVSYSVSDGHTEIRSAPIIGRTGGGTTQHTGVVGGSTYSGTSFSPVTYGVVGSRTYSETVYTRRLHVDITDFLADDGRQTKVYEGKVTSTGTTGSASIAVPYLMRALLKDFPGPPRSTRTVREMMD